MNDAAREWGERIRRFAEVECRESSPLYEAIGLGFADDAELLEWFAVAAGDRANANILFAAVHDLLLRGVGRNGLGAYYASIVENPKPPAEAYPAFRAFCLAERDRLAALLATPMTQTNEVGRCAYLLPAFVRAASLTGRPLAIVDVGAAAGLNLLLDRYAYDYGEDRTAGRADATVRITCAVRTVLPPVAPTPPIAARVGIDLAPIDPFDADATRWLEACVWPEHAERRRNLRAALAVVREERPQVVQGNATGVLPAVCDGIDRDAAIVVVNTNVLPYFSAEERSAYGELIARLGADRDLCWVGIEAPPLTRAAGWRGSFAALRPERAALPLTMTSFVRGERRDELLALTGPHGRWLHWYEGA